MTRSPAQLIEYRNRNPKFWWASNSLHSHVMHGHEVRMSREELYKYAETIDNCEDCGTKLDWERGGHGLGKNGPVLDRRDNKGVVEPGNIAIICRSCSSRKYMMSMNEWELVKDGRLKRCSKCGQIKPIDQFSPGERRYRGRQSHCKKCAAEHIRERRLKNRQR